MAPKKVLVTGANGYIGRAVCNSFSSAGWTVFGLVRSAGASTGLAVDEIIPVIGSFTDFAFVDRELSETVFDIIVSTTEDNTNWVGHFENILELVKVLSIPANRKGKKPLLLYTSGVKDTGESGLLHSPDFQIHDESSPLNPIPILANRANNSPRIFNHQDYFYGVLLRPTLVYGHTASWYAQFFQPFAETCVGETVAMYGDPKTVWHGTHVDDVGDAYVMLAERYYQNPAKAHGEIFIIADDKWDTMEEIVEALQTVYGKRKIEWRVPMPDIAAQTLQAFSQAVCPDKIKRLGWSQKKPNFVDGIAVYKLAWEESVKLGGQGPRKLSAQSMVANSGTKLQNGCQRGS